MGFQRRSGLQVLHRVLCTLLLRSQVKTVVINGINSHMAETCRLQPVRERCEKLWRELEDMLQSAESDTCEAWSSLGVQEEALRKERLDLMSLEEELETVRRSFFDQAQKILGKRRMAIAMSRNVQTELVRVKRLQGQLEQQLKNLQSLVVDIEKNKRAGSSCREMKSVTSWKDLNQGNKVTLPTERALIDVHDLSSQRASLENGFKESNKDTSSCVHSLVGILTGVEELGTDLAAHVVMVSNALQDSGKVKIEAVEVPRTDMYKMKLDKEEDGMCYKSSQKAKVEEIETSGDAHVILANKLQGSHANIESLKLENEMAVNDAQNMCEIQGGNITSTEMVKVKSEHVEQSAILDPYRSDGKIVIEKAEIVELDDEVDHLPLSIRLKLLINHRQLEKELPKNERGGTSEQHRTSSLKKIWQNVKKEKGYRKRMDVPIEIALEEDAPGLWEKLLEKGLVEDMEVYNVLDGGDLCDRFTDLEIVVSKLWGTPTGLFKVAPAIKHYTALNKGPSYCLACLVSLIEQTRSLRQRNWPVKWGWCRQLQAFIFLFEKHNRIVVERPEYGNATYFFELMEYIPVQWQVRRLVTVLSVAALGKSAVLENRPLQVGHDLLEEETTVLESYGWTKDTGLGSFLNFCDRIIHDIKDDDNAEWRQKVGKCLMDGYEKGRITLQNIPQMFKVEDEPAQNADSS